MITRYGIVLLFDDATMKRAISLSEDTRDKGEDPSYVLGTRTNIPHLTLFQLLIDDKEIEGAAEKIREAITPILWPQGELAPLYGEFYRVKAYYEFLFWDSNRFWPLNQLHKAVVEVAAPLRQGDIRPNWPIKPDQEENIRRYGYSAVGNRFHPHITLRRVRSEFTGKISYKTDHEWMASHIAIARTVDNGVLTEVDFTIPIGDE